MTDNIWRGERVLLRALEPADWETHFSWNQDSEMPRRLDRLHFPQSREAAKRWAEKTSLAGGEQDAFFFAIESHAGELVGCISTHQCDARAGTFGYGVAIRQEYQRQGYAREAILLVLRHYFSELRYQKVTVTVYSFNEPSLRLHERLGFQREGQLRRMVYTGGQHHDLVFFGLTDEEFAVRHADPLKEKQL